MNREAGKPLTNIRQFLTDPLLAGMAYAGDTWHAWRVVLAGAFGLQLSVADAIEFARLTGGRTPLAAACNELHLYAGRRAGKDKIAAAIAVYLACLRPWTLSIGEVGVVLVLAADRDQAKVAFGYIRGLLEASPLLSQEIASITADRITLASGIEIQVGTSDHTAVRGRTLLCVIADEFAFWGHEQATEVLRAVRPGMASQPAAMLVVITSLYSQRGPVFETFRRYYGASDPRVLVVRGATLDFNPTIDAAFIAAELERDPAAARAEYLSEFRSDLEGFLDTALVDAATRASPRELPFLSTSRDGGPVHYFAALDVSGGRNDATAAAIAHRDHDRVIVDACRRWPSPHDPVSVAAEVAAFLGEYRLNCAIADQYGAEVVRTVYRDAGVSLSAAEVNRSEAYLHCLPLFTSGRIEIPDEPRLRAELLALERRTGRSGKDSIDHPPGSHDDVANAVALAAWRVSRTSGAGDNLTTAVRSTVLDGFDLQVEPKRYASIFDKYADLARDRWSELDL